MKPVLHIPAEELAVARFDFGTTSVEFLPKQWEFTWAPETDLLNRGGLGSSKTLAGIYRATRLSCFHPGNKGIIGRFAATDLAATTRADCLEFWRNANLLADFKEKKDGIPTAVLYCVDPDTNKKNGKTSIVHFLHVDNPGHLHGYKVGWFWIDEAQETRRAAWNKLVGRTRLAGFQHVFSHFATANANGHDYLWDLFCNPETLSRLTPAERKQRRFIHSTTYENKFLPPEYIADMKRNYSAEDVKRYLEASDDIFEGQIYKEWSPSLHVVPQEVFRGGIPKEWDRYLAVDVGGSEPWSWGFCAVDPWGNVIRYDEIYGPGTRVAPFAEKAMKRLNPQLTFRKKCIDYENKLAAGELAECGIKFDNAKKTNKRESIFRLNGYLHPSQERVFPPWHPKAGEPGAPRFFATANCRAFIGEIGQQRWKSVRGGEGFESIPDDSVPNHAVDDQLYTIRELPKPSELPRDPFADLRVAPTDLRSKLLWHQRLEEKRKGKRHQAQIMLGMCGRGIGKRVQIA